MAIFLGSPFSSKGGDVERLQTRRTGQRFECEERSTTITLFLPSGLAKANSIDKCVSPETINVLKNSEQHANGSI
jgi:hypothetical protein